MNEGPEKAKPDQHWNAAGPLASFNHYLKERMPKLYTLGTPCAMPHGKRPQCPADDHAGMEWWNALTEPERAFWLRSANTAVPAVAWQCAKRSVAGSVPLPPHH